MGNSIQILPSDKIDLVKWNMCIEQSSNALIYADYFYLTNQCDHWAGLIIGDYKTIMPLPWRKKWGIKYLYAPAFIQQLGIFGDLSNLHLQQILNKIKEFAKFGDLFFNYENMAILSEITTQQKTNFILNLNQPYPSIKARYTSDLLKNLQKSEKRKLKYTNNLSVEDAITQFQIQYQSRIPHYNEHTFKKLNTTCIELAKHHKCFIRTVSTQESNDSISTALLLTHKKRIYLLLNTTNSIGRSFAANHYLLDQIIQEFCEEDLVLDFEGSERKGIKEFYESFQPEIQPYFQFTYNNLPFLINWARGIFK